MRIKTLDWLRGLAALSVMIYHFSGSILGRIEDSSTILGRMGIYAVTIFFILSGLSLSIAHSKFKNVAEIQAFFIKRILRLWPAYVIILYVGLYLGLTMHVSQPYSPMLVIKNYLMLFSFSDTNNYLIPTVWSIGNEIVYYAIFPIIVFAYYRNIKIGNCLLALVFTINIWFAFSVLNPGQSLYAQWSTYIYTLNHLFVFVAGVALYFNLKGIVLSYRFKETAILLFVALIMFGSWAGDQIVISSGYTKIILELASIMLVASVYALKINLPGNAERALNALGNYSYSMYLIHVFVAEEVLRLLWGTSQIWQFAFALGATLCLSALVYRFIEKPCIEYGKRITKQT